MSDQNTNYTDDDARADAQALLDLADQLDREADEIDEIVAEASEQMVEDTKEEVAAIEQASKDAEDLEKQINSATN